MLPSPFLAHATCVLPVDTNQLSINVFHLAIAVQFASQVGNVKNWSTTTYNNLLDDVSKEAVAWLNFTENNVVLLQIPVVGDWRVSATITA